MFFLQQAIMYADLGYRVFPCKPGEKTPITKHGCLDATTDHEIIGEWWGRTPNANIGLSTDGLLIIDVDPLKDGTKNTFADDIDRLADLLDAGYGAATPRGGQHFWFQQLPGQDLRNTTGRIAEGVDTRGNGGYILVPPSETVNGKYQWLPGYEIDVSSNMLPPVPLWILELLANGPKAEPIKDDGESIIPDGQRNQVLTSIAGSLRNIGLTQKGIEAALRSINIERCRPPLDNDEVSKIAWSVSRYEPDQTSVAVAEGWFDQQSNQSRQSKKEHRIKNPGDLPASLLNPGGLMGEVINWSLGTAFKPQPELTLAATICLMSAITGRKISDPTGLRTNLYCMSLCESGGGKEHTRKINKDLLLAAGLEKLIGPEGFGSANGITACLNNHPVQLFQVDEFGRFMATTKSAGGSPWLFNVTGVLLKLFASADSLYKGDAVNDLKRVPEINQPHAVLYATTVADSFFANLSKESLSDGFVSRLLLFESSVTDPESQEIDRKPPPKDLVDQVRWWGEFSPGGNLSCEIPQPKVLRPTEEARLIFRELDIAARAQAKFDRPTKRIWSRAVEKAKKLALIHAVSLFRDSDFITEESAKWGCSLASFVTQRMEFKCCGYVSENSIEAQILRIKRIITEAGEEGISASDLCRKTRWTNGKSKTESINSLLETGDIIRQNLQTGGRPIVVYIDSEFSEHINID